MIWKIKDDILIVDKKDEFEHIPQTTSANATVTVTLGHLNSSAFHC